MHIFILQEETVNQSPSVTNTETPEGFLAQHPNLSVDDAKELGRLLAMHGLDLLDAAVFCTLHGVQIPDEVLAGWASTREDLQ